MVFKICYAKNNIVHLETVKDFTKDKLIIKKRIIAIGGDNILYIKNSRGEIISPLNKK